MEKDFKIIHKNPVDKTGMDAEDIELIATDSAMLLAIILGQFSFDELKKILFDIKFESTTILIFNETICIYQNNTILYEVQRL